MRDDTVEQKLGKLRELLAPGIPARSSQPGQFAVGSAPCFGSGPGALKAKPIVKSQ